MSMHPILLAYTYAIGYTGGTCIISSNKHTHHSILCMCITHTNLQHMHHSSACESLAPAPCGSSLTWPKAFCCRTCHSKPAWYSGWASPVCMHMCFCACVCARVCLWVFVSECVYVHMYVHICVQMVCSNSSCEHFVKWQSVTVCCSVLASIIKTTCSRPGGCGSGCGSALFSSSEKYTRYTVVC